MGFLLFSRTNRIFYLKAKYINTTFISYEKGKELYIFKLEIELIKTIQLIFKKLD